MSTLSIPAWLRPAPDSITGRLRRAGNRPWLQAFHGLWSLWVLWPVVFADGGMTYLVPVFWSYPVWLALFVLVNVRPHREMKVYVWALAGLACVTMPFNAAAWSYGVFACAYVPYEGSVIRSVLDLVFVELILLLVAWLLQLPWEYLALMAGICSAVGMGSMTGRVSALKSESERQSQDEVRRLAANAERERIGRDLHDLLGHTLSLITLKLELTGKLLDRDPQRARVELAEAEKVARHALVEVRAAVTGMRAGGLAGEIASARLLLGISEVVLEVEALPALPASVDDVLSLVLREAATNIHRHARASHASVSVALDDATVRMQIRDDGRGGVRRSGNGLSGMRDRVEAVGGSLQVRSDAGEGTELCIEVPMPEVGEGAKAATAQVGQSDHGGFASNHTGNLA